MTDDGADRGKEPVGALNAGKRGQGRGLGLGGILRGQAVALLGIEHRIAFEKSDCVRLVACFLGAGLLFLRHKLVGEIDVRTLLALPDCAAHGDALLEGDPKGRTKAALLKG